MASSSAIQAPAELLAQISSSKDANEKLPEILQSFARHGLGEQALGGLQENLQLGLQLLEANRPRGCFLGKTGSGKTSLLNAILGSKLLPSEETGLAVTSTVTEVTHDPEIETGRVVISTHECSLDEWREKKRLLVNILSGGFGDEPVASDEMCEIATRVMEAACPSVSAEEVLLETEECEEFRGRLTRNERRERSFESGEEAYAWLKDRVHMAESDDVVQSVLTSRVEVKGNFPNLPKDAILVDLPGLEDSNLLRSSVAERYFDLFCNHAWFCMPRAETRILSNRSITRQIRTLARGGRLDNVLLVRTRADEAPRKTSQILQKECQDFQTLCQKELDTLRRPADHADEPPRSRRRTAEDANAEPPSRAGPAADRAAAATGSAGSASTMNFGGFVLATAAPAAEGMAAEIDIAEVVRKLSDVEAKHRQKLHEIIQRSYQELTALVVQLQQLQQQQEAEEERQREVERVQRLREEEQRRRQQLEEDERRRQQLLELQRQREAEQRRAQRAVDQARALRARIIFNFQEAVNQCRRRLEEFRSAFQSVDVQRIKDAILSELQRARHPGGQALKALIARDGMYDSPAKGPFDLVETFCHAVGVFGRSFVFAWVSIVEEMSHRLVNFEHLPPGFANVIESRLQAVRLQINAICTASGPIRTLLTTGVHGSGPVLEWLGGTGAAKMAVEQATRGLDRGLPPTLQRIQESLVGSMEEVLNVLAREIEGRLVTINDPPTAAIAAPSRPSGSGRQAPSQATCIICQVQPATGRANYLTCYCSPRPPYACRTCIPQLDLHQANCPMCRGRRPSA